VFEDVNNNGQQDPGEPAIEGVDVVITDSEGNTLTLTTDATGMYKAEVPIGDTMIDIYESTLPRGYEQTVGTDRTTVNVRSGRTATDLDGFYFRLDPSTSTPLASFTPTPADAPLKSPTISSSYSPPPSPSDATGSRTSSPSSRPAGLLTASPTGGTRSPSPVSMPSKSPTMTPLPTSLPTLPTGLTSPVVSPTLDAPSDVLPSSDAGGGSCTYIKIDFEKLPSDEELLGGEYLTDEFAEYGVLMMSSSGGFLDYPRLFSSANVGNMLYGDSGLGSPNVLCDPSGPGVGDDGAPDQPGENCSPQGNVLIIQEENDNTFQPDSSDTGGTIVFDFASNVSSVEEIGLLDIDEENCTISLAYGTPNGKNRTTIDVIPQGHNSVQTIAVNLARVSQLNVTFTGSGAVTFVGLCLNDGGSSMPSSAPSLSRSPTISPTELGLAAPSKSPPLLVFGSCVNYTIDFDTLPDGTPLDGGAYLSDQWFDEYGLTLSASGGFGDFPRLFNTTHVGTVENGDPDLGAPNRECDTPGPGVGFGGIPGTRGENCEPLGNVLIIQETEKEQPDDNAGGGVITFDFAQPVEFVHEIGMMDIEGDDSVIIVLFEDENGVDERISFTIDGVGNNGVQTVEIGVSRVTQVIVDLHTSGAVSFITFCYQEESTMPSRSPISLGQSTSDSTAKNAMIDVIQALKESDSGVWDMYFDLSTSPAVGKPGAAPVITFSFTPQVQCVNSITMILVDGTDTEITFEYEDGPMSNTATINLSSQSQTAEEQAIHIDKERVKLLIVKLSGQDELAFLDLRLSQGELPLPASAAPSNSNEHGGSFTIDTSSSFCVSSEIIVSEDYENGSADGWSINRVSSSRSFSQFLGRFGKDDETRKVFNGVPIDAESIQISFDFYEIDEWEESDGVRVFIGDQELQLGSLGSATHEVFNSGATSCGIAWQTRSQERPKHIGFNKNNHQFMDQVHHVTITVPASCGVYNKGSIQLAFQTNTNAKRTNEAAGFDNLVIEALHPCKMNVRRALNNVIHESENLYAAPVQQQQQLTGNKSVASVVGVLQVPTDKCSVHIDRNPVSILSQNGDSVTFLVSQVWKDCEEEKDSGWIATDFVAEDGELTCAKTETLGCDSAPSYAAQCTDGASVVDIYVYDDSSDFGQTDGSEVELPTACDTFSDRSKMCHFRYVLSCHAEVTETKPERRLGQWSLWSN
jgi:hypothetical protein